MTLRLSLFSLVFLAASATAFAPAPVFRERPDAALLTKIQGKWEAAEGFVENNGTPIVIIAKDTWAFSGQGGKLLPRRVRLNSRRQPVTLDLEPSEGSTVWTCGIVNLEGDRLTYCFISGEGKELTRPTTFPRNKKFGDGGYPDILIYKRVR